MKQFSANMILSFFDQEDELMIRVERQYTVEALSAGIARAAEVAKISAGLCKMKNVSWNSVIFDVTIMPKKGVTA